MNHNANSSEIARVINEDAQRFVDLDAEEGMNPCGGAPECGNKEALEDLLVSFTAHWFCTQLALPFQHVIYSPNRRFERRCGFDLSVGEVNSTKRRLRIQSKFAANWCDETQLLIFPAENPPRPVKTKLSEAARLFLQIELLCQTFDRSDGRCCPYLMIQQCYCLHEYRRIGATIDNTVIPAIDDQFRSIAIDLSNKEFREAFAAAGAVGIEISLNPTTSKITCESVFEGQKRLSLTVKTLSELVEQLKKDF